MQTSGKIENERATNAGVEDRVSHVVRMILQGYNRLRISKYAQKEWGVGQSAVDGYIGKAKIVIKENANGDNEYEISKAVNRLEDLYSLAYKSSNFKECRNIQAELNKLLGIYAPSKQEHLGKDGESLFPKPRVLSKQELKDYIKDIESEY